MQFLATSLCKWPPRASTTNINPQHTSSGTCLMRPAGVTEATHVSHSDFVSQAMPFCCKKCGLWCPCKLVCQATFHSPPWVVTRGHKNRRLAARSCVLLVVTMLMCGILGALTAFVTLLSQHYTTIVHILPQFNACQGLLVNLN